jgi:hypothetical protein
MDELAPETAIFLTQHAALSEAACISLSLRRASLTMLCKLRFHTRSSER